MFGYYHDDDGQEMIFDNIETMEIPQSSGVVYDSMCGACGIAMEADTCTNQLSCPQCGCVEELDDRAYSDHNKNDSYTTIVKGGRVRNINLNASSAAQSINSLLSHLLNLDRLYFEANGVHILTKDIASKVVTMYYAIQTNYKLSDADDATKTSRIKNRDKTLASLIYRVSNKYGFPREEKEIARMMCLPKETFTIGEEVVRMLIKEGVLDLNINNLDSIIDKRLEMLGIYKHVYTIDEKRNTNYRDFVTELIAETKARGLRMELKQDTKIAGALAILIAEIGYEISEEKFNKVVSKKKSSYNIFVKTVLGLRPQFEHVFKKHLM
jgi:hypothetical protein